MFNVGGGELLVIFLVAMIVIGPTKLPGAARQVGEFLTHVRRISNDFKRELQDAVPEEVTELTQQIDETRRSLRSSLTDDAIERKAREKGRALLADEKAAKAGQESKPAAEAESGSVDTKVSSAAAAGMFSDDDRADEANAIAATNGSGEPDQPEADAALPDAEIATPDEAAEAAEDHGNHE